MPYRSIKKDKCYEVVNEQTGMKHAKCTTKTKAAKQLRLLRGIESGKWKPATSYKEFVKQQFKKRPAGMSASAYMKEIGAKWSQIKGKGMCGAGDTLLLQPQLGQTSAEYVGAGMMGGAVNAAQDIQTYIQKLNRIKTRARDAWTPHDEQVLMDLRAAYSMMVDDNVQFDDDLIAGMEASAQNILNQFPSGREEMKG